MSDLMLKVGLIPEDHTVIGYVAHVKVLDDEGRAYYAQRSDGVDDMEKVGLAVTMADDFRDQMIKGRVDP